MTRSDPMRRAIEHVAALSTGDPVDPDLRVTLNFHPDRIVHGKPVLRSLAQDGIYRCQFETGTSNGGLTAYPGGDRWHWERQIFGGAYDDVVGADRPKYGALNFPAIRRRGAAVRVGPLPPGRRRRGVGSGPVLSRYCHRGTRIVPPVPGRMA